jgi:hypothetical protein
LTAHTMADPTAPAVIGAAEIDRRGLVDLVELTAARLDKWCGEGDTVAVARR